MIPRIIALFFTYMMFPYTGSASSNEEAKSSFDNAFLYENSQYWPAKTKLIQQVEIPSRSTGALSNGTQGVLIRLQDFRYAIIDFGRDGIHTVAVNDTTLLEEANKIRDGITPKHSGNFVSFLSNRVYDLSADKDRSLSSSDLNTYKKFLCIYAEDNPKKYKEIGEVLQKNKDILVREKILPLVLIQYMEKDRIVSKTLRDNGFHYAFMFPFLSQAYTMAFQHNPTTLPYFVLVDDNGKLLSDSSSGKDSRVERQIVEVLSIP